MFPLVFGPVIKSDLLQLCVFQKFTHLFFCQVK